MSKVENMVDANSMPSGCPVGDTLLCIGVAPYDFVPKGETERRTGFGVWFVEEKANCFGQIPRREGFGTDAFNEHLFRLGLDSPADLVGKRWSLVYNRYGKVDAFYPAI